MIQGVSVIVCCYNSTRRLPSTLTHLARQRQLDNIPFEIIIVDNASTDDTGKVAVKLWNEYGSNVPLRVVYEKQPGQYYARHLGINEAKFETIVFCDDDNWLDKNYLAIAFDIFRDETIAATGGTGTPEFETSEPKWFKQVSTYFAVGNQLKNKMNGIQYLYGAGLVVRKSALKKLFDGGFSNASVGRVGNAMTSGDDVELTLALHHAGYKVVFDDRLKFRHFIPKGRLTIKYFRRLMLGIGYSSEFLYPIRRKIDDTLVVPYPNKNSLVHSWRRVFATGIVMMLPLPRYGRFINKFTVFLYELGRLKFQLSKQNFFR